MSASPAPNQGAEQEKRVAFKFCSECSNILYPKEDTQNSTLMFECRTCRWSCQADTSCIYRNELSTAIGATAGVTQDVSQDPTVGTSRSASHSNPTHSSHNHDHMMEVDAVGNSGHAGGGGFSGSDPDYAYEAYGHEDIPDICILCGEPVTCDICGEASYGGTHVFVNEFGQISSARVQTSQDGNIGSFVIEPLELQPSQDPSQQHLAAPQQPFEQTQTPSPPPSP